MVDDILIVGPGEVLPADGSVMSEVTVLDESALTGESIHVERHAGELVCSGALNAGGVIEMRATATAANSTYAGVVRLALEAAAATAPVVRLADRAAGWFLPLTLGVAGLAWLISGSADRAVAVLVVATPCPLLLAAPVAIVSGLSRASRLGVVIRGGGALENLGGAKTLVMDKTGTLTTGRPRGTDIIAAPGIEAGEVLRLAASADQISPHVLAEAIVHEAKIRGTPLSLPVGVSEDAGVGVTATVEGHRVTVGSRPRCGGRAGVGELSIVEGHIRRRRRRLGHPRRDADRRDPADGPAAARRTPHAALRRLRSAGLDRFVMLTGDRLAPAEEIGAVLGLDAVYAQQTPTEKVAHVRAEQERTITVMVGDGVNDAPALAAATVGVAMGARGSTASSEAADIVLTTNRLDHLADAMAIARRLPPHRARERDRRDGLVVDCHGFCCVRLLPPAAGALLQEGIDVAVILNAFRALRGGDVGAPALTHTAEDLIKRFAAEHNRMRDDLAVLRDAAQRLSNGPPDQVLPSLQRADSFLQQTIVSHELAEDRELYPALADPLGSSEATATMSRMHGEIERLARRLHAHADTAPRQPGRCVPSSPTI